jgi:hypothetical protein
MDPELLQLNLLLGLCWPKNICFNNVLFKDLGYRIEAIEPHYKLSGSFTDEEKLEVWGDITEPPSEERTITPDLILVSEELSSVLIVECASGQFCDRKIKQMKRYKLFDQPDLIHQMSLPSLGKNKNYKLNTILLVEKDYLVDYINNFKKHSFLEDIVILEVDFRENYLKLAYGRILDIKLHNLLLDEGIRFDSAIPVNLYPIKLDNEKETYIERIGLAILKFQNIEKYNNIFTRDFIKEIYPQTIEYFDSHYINAISGKICKTLNFMIENDFKNKIKPVNPERGRNTHRNLHSPDNKWRIIEKPLQENRKSSTQKNKKTVTQIVDLLAQYVSQKDQKEDQQTKFDLDSLGYKD